MRLKRIACFLIMGIALVAFMPLNAFAYTITHLPDDPAFLGLYFDLDFIAEGRIGDLEGSATFEVDLQNADHQIMDSYLYGGWVSGQIEAFTLTYDATGLSVSFETLGQTLLYDPSEAATVTDIFIRTRATVGDTSVRVNNIVVNGNSLTGEQSYAENPGDTIDYLWISGLTPSDNITITGDTILTWGATIPTQSNLAYQIKAGTVVPIPAAFWLFTSGLIGLAGCRRKMRE